MRYLSAYEIFLKENTIFEVEYPTNKEFREILSGIKVKNLFLHGEKYVYFLKLPNKPYIGLGKNYLGIWSSWLLASWKSPSEPANTDFEPENDEIVQKLKEYYPEMEIWRRRIVNNNTGPR